MATTDLKTETSRVLGGIRDSLKALVVKMGGTVPDGTKFDALPDIVAQMALNLAAKTHTHKKADIDDFPASMTPTAHKASHKTGGSDAIAPADIGAAASSHKHQKADITDFPTSMTPTAHKASHKTGGSDAITPADIGAAASTHSHTKSQITDFPASMAPTAHKASHKTGGADALAPADIGAAKAQTVVPITLTAAGWDATTKRQVASVAGVLADYSKQKIEMAFSSEAAILAYGAAGILAVAQGANSLTFQCSTVPEADIAVNIIIQPL